MPRIKLDFDAKKLIDDLAHPDWYVRNEEWLRTFMFPINDSKTGLGGYSYKDVAIQKHKFYDLIVKYWRRIPLAKSGKHFVPRGIADKVVVHHTKTLLGKGQSWSDFKDKLKAIGLARQDASRFLDQKFYGLPFKKGDPIWTDRTFYGQPTSYSYHWIVWPSGGYDQLLDEASVAIHTNDDDINSSSIAIALVGDYDDANIFPPWEQKIALAEIIAQRYCGMEILGHGELQEQREFAKDKFAWKEEILSAISLLRQKTRPPVF